MSNDSNMTDDINDTTRIINVFNYLLYTLIVVLGVPGNVLVVWSLLSTHREEVNRSYRILVINLAINDIIIVLITSPFQIVELRIPEEYPFGRTMCSILWPLQTACYGAGVFNMVALNVHRFYVISYPTSSRSLGKITFVAVAMCWIVPTLITALPYAMTLEYRVSEKDGKLCEEQWGDDTANSYTIYLLSVQYILPLIVIATLNLLTIRRLKRRYMFRANCARLSEDNLHAHRRIVKMLIYIILVFALFGLPGQIVWLLPVINSNIEEQPGYYAIFLLVDSFNNMYCVLNPVLFFTFNNECSVKLKKFLASVFFCCGYHWDISSPTGIRREAVTTLLPASRASDSQDTSQSDGPKIDPRYAPAIPKYLLGRLDENSTKVLFDKDKQHSVPVALFSTFTGLYTPVASYHGNNSVVRKNQGSSQVLKVAGDEEIFRESFVELLRTNDLIKRLDESPETAILEEGECQMEQDKV